MRAFLEDAAGRAWGGLRPIRNRGFASRVRHDPDAPAILLSPHLDDAVLSCWSVVSGADAVTVMNVFTGVAEAGAVAYYDRLAGARDSVAHVGHRIAEDRQALGRAGRSPLNLGFLARSYRRGRPEPSFERIDAVVAAHARAAAVMYAPAALGMPHPDHELVRDFALGLAAAGMQVRLYADLPYCAVYGWPSWVTGQESGPHLDVDAYWSGSGGKAAPLLTRARAEVVHLDPGRAADKMAAMRTYREFAVLDRGPIGQLSNPAIHAHEVFWTIRDGDL